MLHGQTRYNVPSRFFDEIPPALLKRMNTAAARPYTGSAFGVSARMSASPASVAQSSAGTWRVGQNVVHPKFGQGVIITAEGRGADARVQVNFRNAGTKWLALDYARLTPA